MWCITLSVILTSVILLLVWSYTSFKYSYFRKRNIPYLPPTFPWGNVSSIGSQNNLLQWAKHLYFSFRDHRPSIGGLFVGLEPVIVVTDLDQIQSVLVTNFASFTDNGFFINERDDPLSAVVFAMRGQRWRNMRTKLSPTFSNKNTRNMFDLVHATGWEMLQFLEETAVRPQEPFNAKSLAMRFICDSIGSCGFGLNCGAFRERDPQVLRRAEQIMPFSKYLQAYWLLTSVYAKWARFLRLSVFPRTVTKYFRALINETVQYREEHRVVRNDFMNILIQMKNKGCLTDDESGEVLDSITGSELEAQAFIIFVAGFHTSSVVLSFALFELAGNSTIQERLREEVLGKLGEDGQLTYDALEGMDYLQQVVDETLRKYPPQPYLTRVATADAGLPGTDYQIRKGDHLYIPVVGVHYDSDIYPDPDRFEPERMAKENMKARHQCSFMPFGLGPRMCIGYRFGLLQLKLAIAMMLIKYRLTVNSRTKQPLAFVPHQLNIEVKEGIWLNAYEL